MKRWKLFALLLVLAVLCACGQKEPAAPLAGDPAAENTPADEPSVRPSDWENQALFTWDTMWEDDGIGVEHLELG